MCAHSIAHCAKAKYIYLSRNREVTMAGLMQPAKKKTKASLVVKHTRPSSIGEGHYQVNV